MKGNPDKCHLLLNKNDNFGANINENRISNTRFKKLLGVTFDNQLNFNHHISKFAKQPVINLMHSLKFPTTWMKIKGEYFPIRTSLSQFIYCPLIWMKHNKSINKKIDNLHERALRLIHCDHSSNF